MAVSICVSGRCGPLKARRLSEIREIADPLLLKIDILSILQVYDDKSASNHIIF